MKTIDLLQFQNNHAIEGRQINERHNVRAPSWIGSGGVAEGTLITYISYVHNTEFLMLACWHTGPCLRTFIFLYRINLIPEIDNWK